MVVKGKARGFKGVLAFVMAMALAFSVMTIQAFAAADSVDVYIRVESSAAGDSKTLLPRTLVTVPQFDLTEYGKDETPDFITPLHAVITATENELVFSFSQWGVYITEILGVVDDGAQSWMYSVNNASVAVGSDQYALKDGDEVIFYYIGWEAGSFASFNYDSITVKEGVSLELALMGNNYTNGDFAVEGAAIIVNDEATELVTDAEGKITLDFPEAGQFIVSATREDEEGATDISRPFTLVNVVAEEDFAMTLSEENVLMVGGVQVVADVIGFHDNDEAYIPLRAVAKSIGATVGWDAEAGAATVTLGDVTATVNINDYNVKVVNFRTLVTCDFFADNFGLGLLAE